VNERAVGEQTRRRKVQENMQMAMEVNPEDFTKIPMLFIACRVNGHRIVALVDTGAQCSVMGRRAADACGITQLLDTRFKGVAKGVGTAGIVGKVHLTEVVVGHQTFAMSITVMADQTQIDFILGLDVIRKYQCVIDMTQNCMIIGGEKVAFCSQSGGR
jgi:DNA damage-inducible protein 1